VAPLCFLLDVLRPVAVAKQERGMWVVGLRAVSRWCHPCRAQPGVGWICSSKWRCAAQVARQSGGATPAHRSCRWTRCPCVPLLDGRGGPYMPLFRVEDDPCAPLPVAGGRPLRAAQRIERRHLHIATSFTKGMVVPPVTDGDSIGKNDSTLLQWQVS
jgi:hypothetical protein